MDVNTAFSNHLITTVDHSDLTNKSADDHLQYFNQTRGDARYDLAHSATNAIASHIAAANPHSQYFRLGIDSIHCGTF